MNIKAKFTPADVAAKLKKEVDKIEASTVNALSKEGEKFVRNARLVNTYIDQTGNLRSSIGYVILKDGRQITGSAFEVVKDGHKGRETGLNTVKEAAKKHTKGYVLIVVAGMNYSAHVEKTGRDVLTNSSVTAEQSIRAALQKLTEKIK